MDYFSNTGLNATSTLSTRPNLHDFEQLNSIYNHLDNTSTVAFRSVASLASDVNENPNSWGEHMAEFSRGQSAYYKKIHTDGSITITHVYWSEETAGRCKRDICDLRFE